MKVEVAMEMSAREAGYLLRMAARGGSAEIFGVVRGMLTRHHKVQIIQG